MSKKAIVLLSGGLDSTTVAAIVRSQGYEISALSFRYGQRHQGELAAAATIARVFEIKKHVVADIDLRLFGGSALTADIDVPKHDQQSQNDEVPITYVPARNTIFLSFALAWAEVLKCHDIFIGVNAVDYSGYPDCRPEFIQSFETMANLATVIGTETKQKIAIHAPLMAMTKADIITAGMQLGVDYGLTTSCYDPEENGAPCCRCDACLLRAQGFREAGFNDPQLALFSD